VTIIRDKAKALDLLIWHRMPKHKMYAPPPHAPSFMSISFCLQHDCLMIGNLHIKWHTIGFQIFKSIIQEEEIIIYTIYHYIDVLYHNTSTTPPHHILSYPCRAYFHHPSIIKSIIMCSIDGAGSHSLSLSFYMSLVS
jgi:hypothetical protein